MHQTDGGSVYFDRLKMCARWTFDSGWRVRVGVDTRTKVWAFENPTFYDTNLRVRYFTTCSGATNARSSKTESRTFLTASNFSMKLCSLNASYGAGLPWGVSMGIAPTCTNDSKRARRIRTIEPVKPAHELNFTTQGTAGRWNKTEWWHDAKTDRSLKACFKLRVYLDVQNASGTRTADITTKPVTDNFCLPVGSWAMAIAGR